MTDWLDPEEVKKARERMTTPRAPRLKEDVIAVDVVRAIAALPQPIDKCSNIFEEGEGCLHESRCFAHVWRACRAALGMEEGDVTT